MDRDRLLLTVDSAPRFPTLLDTGYNGTLAMNPRHLRDWLGYDVEEDGCDIDVKSFPFTGDRAKVSRVSGITAASNSDKDEYVKCFRGLLWIHPNVPGTCDSLRDDVDPVELETSPGFVVFPESIRELRLPLLGLELLRRNRLKIVFEDTQNKSFSFSIESQAH